MADLSDGGCRYVMCIDGIIIRLDALLSMASPILIAVDNPNA